MECLGGGQQEVIRLHLCGAIASEDLSDIPSHAVKVSCEESASEWPMRATLFVSVKLL